MSASSKPHCRDDRKKIKRQSPGSDSSKDKTVRCKTKRPDEQINSQDDDKKKKKKAKVATDTKLPKKDAAKEKTYSDDAPASKIRKLIPDQKLEKLFNRSDDQPSSEQKSKSEAIASMENEHNSSVAKNDLEDSDFHDSRVVPDVDGVQKPAEEDSVQKTDAKQTSKVVKAGKPSFVVPSSGSSKPLENKTNLGSKMGFCPPVKTKKLENSSAVTLKHVKPKAAADEKAKDQIVENGGDSGGQSYSKEVNEAELSGDEVASAFDELADEICSVAAEEGQGLQQLVGQSASLVGRTKEEKYTIDVQVCSRSYQFNKSSAVTLIFSSRCACNYAGSFCFTTLSSQ